MTASSINDPAGKSTLGILGSNPLAERLLDRAKTAQIAAVCGNDSEALSQCDTIWITDPHWAAANQMSVSVPAAVVVSGYQPSPAGSGAFPTLRLTSPADSASLAEILPASNTADEILQTLAGQAQQMNYQALILACAQDGFACRVTYSLMIEAMALLGEGVAPQKIEDAAAAFGMQEPPLAMLDALSLTVMDHDLHAELHALEHGHEHKHGHDHGHAHDHGEHHHDHGHHHNVSSQRFPESAVYVLEKMAHGFDRLGADSGYGFYDHDDDGTRELWDGLSVFSRGARPVPEADIIDRLVYIQAIETQRCVTEGLLSAAQADLASMAGWGFPRAIGGVCSWMQNTGNEQFADRAAALADSYGKRFQPAG